MNKQDNKKIQDLQFLEQNLQHLFLQKQAFQLELNETTAALKELKGSGNEVFKLIGQIMIKTDKENIQRNLQDKEKMLELRIKSIEEQENSLFEKVSNLREELIENNSKK